MGFYMLILFSATSRNSLVLTDFVCPYVCVCGVFRGSINKIIIICKQEVTSTILAV